MDKQKTILITPLNWGLGHATRIVPLVKYLLKYDAKVILAADKRPYDFLTKTFPDLPIIRLPGFEPAYSGRSMMAIKMAYSFPKMWVQARKSHKLLQDIIDEYQVDVVISDNRYECYSKKAYSILITHQLNIQTHGIQFLLKPLIDFLVNHHITHFNELWVPDFENSEINLSGKLSDVKSFPINRTHFIGPLSRFQPKINHQKNEVVDLLVLLSGPEPQRSILQNIITQQALQSNLRTTILLGKPGNKVVTQKGNVQYISHVNDSQFSSLIQSANIIISRPGYTTVMDLSVFGKKAILIPTPGQTEQEYLAKRLKKHGYCYSVSQKSFKLEKSLQASEKYKGLPIINANADSEIFIKDLLCKYS